MREGALPVPPSPAAPAAGTIRCPVCASPFRPDETVRRCERCDTPHHEDCWDYVGHCAVFGCQPGETRPAVTEEEFHGLRRSLDRWLWSYRLYAIVLALGPRLDRIVFVGELALVTVICLLLVAPSPMDWVFPFWALAGGLLFLVVIAGFFLCGPLQAARDRLSYLATVQNRSALGWKGKG